MCRGRQVLGAVTHLDSRRLPGLRIGSARRDGRV